MKKRIADLFEENPEFKRIFVEHIRRINDKYELGVEEVGVFCGEPYPADECVNCTVKDAVYHGPACLFYIYRSRNSGDIKNGQKYRCVEREGCVEKTCEHHQLHQHKKECNFMFCPTLNHWTECKIIKGGDKK